MTGLVIQGLLIGICLLTGVLYFLKARELRDLTYIASGLTRMYLGYILFSLEEFPAWKLGIPDIKVAIAILLLADIIQISILFLSRKFKKTLEYNEMVDKLKEIGGKHALIVENEFVGFFTTDMNGMIEFVNHKFCTMLGYTMPEVLGKNIFGFFGQDSIPNILVLKKFYFPFLNMKSKDGKIIKVQLSGGPTQNGHSTITGMINPLP